MPTLYENRENRLPDDVLKIVVDTDGAVIGTAALDWATSVVEFFEGLDAPDGTYDVEIRHLGRGSTVLELVFLGMAAVAGVGMFGIKLHETLTAGREEVAAQTLSLADNFGGSNVFIFVASRDAPLQVRIDEIRANSGATGYQMTEQSKSDKTGGDPPRGDSASPVIENADGYEPDYLETENGEILTTEDGDPLEIGRRPIKGGGEEEYDPPNLEVEGIVERNGEQILIETLDGSYEISEVTGDRPPRDRYIKFYLVGPLQEYGRKYRLIDWVDQHKGRIVVLTGRMVETDDGMFLRFKTDSETFAPELPDDLFGWIPRGRMVEVEGYIPDDDPSSLVIFTWAVVEEEGLPAYAGATSENDDNAPIEILGRVVSTFDGRIRLLRSGRREYQLINDHNWTDMIPDEAEIVLLAQMREGNRLMIEGWRLPTESKWRRNEQRPNLDEPKRE